MGQIDNAGGRGAWGSRFGFIMATAGAAIGLGNIWKFPYMAGGNGGGAFLIIYLVFVVALGLPLVMAELLMGRMSQRNPVGAYRRQGGRGWPVLGALGVVTAFIILSFYIVVAGWALAYLGYAASGTLTANDAGGLSQLFGRLTGGVATPLIYAALFMALTGAVVAAGIDKGIERASKLFMPLLFVILILLMARALTLPGAAAGLHFFLVPDWHKVTGATFTAAIGQAFFSLSLGIGALITYGSYLPREQNLPSDALVIVVLNTVASLLAGLMVLPAMFAAHIQPGAGGPGVTFKVLPSVFAAMPDGAVFAFGFFALLALAALTSSVSLLEPIVSYAVDELKLGRAPATLLCCVMSFALAIPVSLSFGAWHDVTFFGKTFFGLMDFMSSSLMLPIGGLGTALCVGWVLGRQALRAIGNDGALQVPWGPLWLFTLRVVAPLGIVWILLQAFI